MRVRGLDTQACAPPRHEVMVILLRRPSSLSRGSRLQRLKEQRERRSESLAKKRALRASVASKEA